MQMPFGKYKGRPLSSVPDDYLLWVLDNVESLSPTLRRAIEARLGVAPPPPPPPPPTGHLVAIEKVIRSWHRQMALKYHPDRGGSHEQMLIVNEGAELLKQLAGL